LVARPTAKDEIWLVAEVDGVVVGNVAAELHRPVETAARQLLRSLGETACLSARSVSSRPTSAAALRPG
jgi:hypothetical protein